MAQWPAFIPNDEHIGYSYSCSRVLGIQGLVVSGYRMVGA